MAKVPEYPPVAFRASFSKSRRRSYVLVLSAVVAGTEEILTQLGSAIRHRVMMSSLDDLRGLFASGTE